MKSGQCLASPRDTDHSLGAPGRHRRQHIKLWIERIPTHANPADQLSRVGTSHLESLVQSLLLPGWAVCDAAELSVDFSELQSVPTIKCRGIRTCTEAENPLRSPSPRVGENPCTLDLSHP